MQAYRTLVYETILLLYRNKFLFPFFVGLVFFSFFASILSSWVIEEFDKVIFDFYFFVFHILGSMIAIFWEEKSLLMLGLREFLNIILPLQFLDRNGYLQSIQALFYLYLS